MDTRTLVSIQNGMMTEYGYDGRNRLKKIAHLESGEWPATWNHDQVEGLTLFRYCVIMHGPMKTRSKAEKHDELRAEYPLRELLKKGVQGKYAARCREGRTNFVLLAPDVAKAFSSEQAINDALRLVIQLKRLPTGRKKTSSGS